jgi:phage gpG-like protein
MLAGRIIGAETVLSHLYDMPAKVRARVAITIQRLTMELLRKVHSEKLSGQVLMNRTGTLRHSVNPKVEDRGTAIVGSVGTNLVYAKAHEFGVDKQVTIREHLRTVTMAWGRELASPVVCTVRSHSAHMRLPQRSFLRSSLEEMRGQIRFQLIAAMREGVQR